MPATSSGLFTFNSGGGSGYFETRTQSGGLCSFAEKRDGEGDGSSGVPTPLDVFVKAIAATAASLQSDATNPRDFKVDAAKCCRFV